MQIDTCHFEIHVHSLEEAKNFYVGTLGFEVLQTLPAANLLSVRAGSVRISIFADVTLQDIAAAAKAGSHIVFRTPDLTMIVAALNHAGIQVPEVSEAPGFMRYVSLRDPSGNPVEIAEYLRDPLQKV